MEEKYNNYESLWEKDYTEHNSGMCSNEDECLLFRSSSCDDCFLTITAFFGGRGSDKCYCDTEVLLCTKRYVVIIRNSVVTSMER